MRTKLSPALFLIVAVFMFAGAGNSLAHVPATPGLVVITCSPVLGTYIGIPIEIDGRQAGVLTKGHKFQQHLSPGRHVITVSRNGRPRETTHTVVDVQPGHTYHFTAKYHVNEVILVGSNKW